MIFETHCHLDDSRFEADRQEVVTRLRQQGIAAMVNVGYDLESSARSVELAQEHAEIYAAVGIHPHDASGISENGWEQLEKLADAPKVVALGEMGLDYYRDLSPRPVQQQAFSLQLELANKLKLPVIIHNRDAHQDTIRLLRAKVPARGGVLHCFSGSWETAKQALDLGLYISFAGPLTYRNAVNLRQVATLVPLDRLLVETDSPYLTPEPLRGRRNEPAYVRYVVEKLAEIRSMDVEELAARTAENGAKLFGVQLT